MKKTEAETTPGVATVSAADSAMDVDEDVSQSQAKRLPSGDAAATPASPAPAMNSRMKRTSSRSVASPALAAYQAALSDALAYGKTLHAEHPRPDSATGLAGRPEAQALLKTTFSLVTYEDPRLAGGDVQAFCSQEARARLAQEVNQAILGWCR